MSGMWPGAEPAAGGAACWPRLEARAGAVERDALRVAADRGRADARRRHHHLRGARQESGRGLPRLLPEPADGRRTAIAELLLKATPLMLIAVGLAVGFRANVWNIGAEGQFLDRARSPASGIALGFEGSAQPRCCCRRWSSPAPSAARCGRRSRRSCRTRFNANEILTSLMLVYIAQLARVVARARAVEGSGRASISRRPKMFARRGAAADPDRRHAAQRAFLHRARARSLAGYVFMQQELHRASRCGRRRGRGRGALRRLLRHAARSGSGCSPAAPRPGIAGMAEVAGPDGPAHRARLAATTASPRSSSPSSGG